MASKNKKVMISEYYKYITEINVKKIKTYRYCKILITQFYETGEQQVAELVNYPTHKAEPTLRACNLRSRKQKLNNN